MSLVVEDGTGIATAESYCSVADADTYHTNQGNAAWALLSTTLKEQALRRATTFMEGKFRDIYAGYRKGIIQSLSWPRIWVPVRDAPAGYGSFMMYYPQDTVPAAVSAACAKLALIASTEDLSPALKQGVIKRKIGPLETEYDRFSPQGTRYREIYMLLNPFVKSSGNSVGLARA